MRWTWIVCVGVALGCGPAVDSEGGTEGGAETGGGSAGSSTGVQTTSDSEVPEPTTGDPVTTVTDGTGSSGSTSSGSSSSEGSSSGESTGDPATGEDFFLAIAASVAPTTPFQFVAEVEAEADQLVIVLTPLSLDVGSVDSPREPIPPPFEVSGPLGADGSFTIQIPNLEIPGAANPITGSDVVATATLEGVFEMDRICGRVSGMITAPANIDLSGSTVAGVRTEGGPLPLPDDLDCMQ